MTPHFAFWTCEDCDDTILERDCYGNGRYCAINENNVNTTGKDILNEDLRQKCIHEKYVKEKKESVWWDYIKSFHSICKGSEVTEDCS